MLKKEIFMLQELPITVCFGNDYIFSIYDCARKAYTAPFLASTLEQAKRFCVEQINVSSTSFFALYPNSFVLYCLGSFDHSNGSIENVEPLKIGTFNEIQVDILASNQKSKPVSTHSYENFDRPIVNKEIVSNA
ncbi:nonstructural protein [Microvirus mar38]|uniref:Nonstructural protein n=1 Tax=Microvirus mar38 TaxID=2851172 RepID=A0A8F5XVF9_9VIRU|nr:nonstructural protein [Microvirus mar38]